MTRGHSNVASRALLSALAAGVLAAAGSGCGKVPLTPPSGCLLSVTANPTSIQLTGGTSTITVTIFNKNGFPVPDDTEVQFTTTLGSVTPKAKTQNGVATAVLSSNGVAGSATVSVLTGACTGKDVMITIGVTPDSIALNATPASLPTGGGTVALSATVFGSTGSPVPGATVVFSTTQGSLTSGGGPVLTDASGRATDTLNTNRTADVTATSGSKTKTITVPVGATGVNTIVLSADRASLPAGGGSVTLSAVVLGDAGPLSGVAVAWSASAGTLGTPGVTVTDASGVATNTLDTTVNSEVKAAAGGKEDVLVITVGSAATDVKISVSPGRSSIPGQMTPPGDCSTIPPVGTNILPIPITAQVTDDLGNPLPGREVLFYESFEDRGDCSRAYGQFCTTTGRTVTAVTDGTGSATVWFMATQDDLNFCNCLPGPPNCAPPLGFCTGSCSAQATCRLGPPAEDLFCQVVFRATSSGVTSSNFASIEYGR